MFFFCISDAQMKTCDTFRRRTATFRLLLTFGIDHLTAFRATPVVERTIRRDLLNIDRL